ncbi:MAG: CpsD/CapB family tyrosine-protein kinase [Fusobacteria bacterium]|nr:CpsD/CapB family tyrosine-protein kinase [Fusobacteriota bacterium]
MRRELIVEFSPQSIYAEQYRTLRNNIYFSNIDKKLKIIQVTSSVPSEGKTTTISNLAVVFAQNEKKILLIDADLRKPTVHKKFLISNDKGLSNIIVGESIFTEVVQRNVYPGVDIVTSGPIPPNPSELLHSEGFHALIEDSKNNYDFILIDSPPVAPISDAKSIAQYSSGIVFVCDISKTSAVSIKAAKKELEKVNKNILGVVINKLTKKNQNRYNYYQYQYDYNEGK